MLTLALLTLASLGGFTPGTVNDRAVSPKSVVAVARSKAEHQGLIALRLASGKGGGWGVFVRGIRVTTLTVVGRREDILRLLAAGHAISECAGLSSCQFGKLLK